MQPRIASGAAIRPEDLVAQMAEVRGSKKIGQGPGGAWGLWRRNLKELVFFRGLTVEGFKLSFFFFDRLSGCVMGVSRLKWWTWG